MDENESKFAKCQLQASKRPGAGKPLAFGSLDFLATFNVIPNVVYHDQV
jgi:hypothetical protein